MRQKWRFHPKISEVLVKDCRYVKRLQREGKPFAGGWKTRWATWLNALVHVAQHVDPTRKASFINRYIDEILAECFLNI